MRPLRVLPDGRIRAVSSSSSSGSGSYETTESSENSMVFLNRDANIPAQTDMLSLAVDARVSVSSVNAAQVSTSSIHSFKKKESSDTLRRVNSQQDSNVFSNLSLLWDPSEPSTGLSRKRQRAKINQVNRIQNPTTRKESVKIQQNSGDDAVQDSNSFQSCNSDSFEQIASHLNLSSAETEMQGLQTPPLPSKDPTPLPSIEKDLPLTKYEQKIRENNFNWEDLCMQRGYFHLDENWKMTCEKTTDAGVRMKIFKRENGICGFTEYLHFVDFPGVTAQQHWAMLSDHENFDKWRGNCTVETLHRGLSPDGDIRVSTKECFSYFWPIDDRYYCSHVDARAAVRLSDGHDWWLMSQIALDTQDMHSTGFETGGEKFESNYNKVAVRQTDSGITSISWYGEDFSQFQKWIFKTYPQWLIDKIQNWYVPHVIDDVLKKVQTKCDKSRMRERVLTYTLHEGKRKQS